MCTVLDEFEKKGEIKATIEEAKFWGISFDAAVKRVIEKYNFSEEEAQEKVTQYWK